MSPRRTSTCSKTNRGRGLLNSLINSLPFELHLPGDYRYCGPGTRLAERLKRGDPGINPLDEACKSHDIAYSKTKDTTERNKADLILADRAWERVKASDSSLGERAAAYAVTNAMKLKAKLGMGLNKTVAAKKPKPKKKKRASKKKTKPVERSIERILALPKMGAGASKKKKKKPAERILAIPKTGAGVKNLLTSIGLAARTITPVAKMIKTVIDGSLKKNVHLGEGLYLRPYRKGYGLYLRPYRKNLN